MTGSAGLVLGLRHPALEGLTLAALTGYYGAAFAFHLGVRNLRARTKLPT